MMIVTHAGAILQGTPKQIAQEMFTRSHQKHATLIEYLDWAAHRALAYEGVELCLTGSNEDERAESFVNQLLLKGLVKPKP